MQTVTCIHAHAQIAQYTHKQCIEIKSAHSRTNRVQGEISDLVEPSGPASGIPEPCNLPYKTVKHMSCALVKCTSSVKEVYTCVYGECMYVLNGQTYIVCAGHMSVNEVYTCIYGQSMYVCIKWSNICLVHWSHVCERCIHTFIVRLKELCVHMWSLHTCILYTCIHYIHTYIHT